jgi:hypothetical protein
MAQPATLNFHWQTDCAHVKDQPYQVVFKITDKSPTGSRLVTFNTWFIRVVGPEPEWVNATVDPPTRSANLQWDPYACLNAQSIQIWRRVDSFAFTPDSCQTGMPDNLGYTLINTVAAKDTSNHPITTYTDTNGGQGLASGAQYCYRLVALFPLPKGGASYVSDEICLPPILADKAIITNVTVDQTSADAGEITVKWVAPYEADATQFPPPYTYSVVRAEGFTGNGNLTVVGSTADTTFTDTGLDTDAKIYNYRIVAIDANGTPLDSSATASAVRLEADSQANSIALSWNAVVPWSNKIQTVPHKHVIYRGAEGATPEEMEPIDSVDVSASGFTFVDDGSFQGLGLNPNEVYCYRVETIGGYGNPAIREPLFNFSQIICAIRGDTIPPCSPGVPFPDQPPDCLAYSSSSTSCNNNVFENIIHWNRPECDTDISYYRVWVASSSTGKFSALPGEIRDTTYVDTILPSFARCYKIQAVDRSGNAGELSEAVCLDNCPYYELPNMFSPNGDGCNDLFSAFSDRNLGGENHSALCNVVFEASQAKCARFVERVDIRIYNRWGKEVYAYESGGERTIYVDWDGHASDGTELSTGVYYYVADVTFDSVDPAKRNQVIKGWVHLMR